MDYNWLYFTDAELRELTRGQLQDVPVKAEHRWHELGRVVSSFVDGDGRMNCVMQYLTKEPRPSRPSATQQKLPRRGSHGAQAR